MGWEVEFIEDFEVWWNSLTEEEQDSVDWSVGLLEASGPALGYPHSSKVLLSKHSNMRELRVQHQGRPYRILYAFDPRRAAILLLGGDKTGGDRWYEENVPRADKIYDAHLVELQKEGLSSGTKV